MKTIVYVLSVNFSEELVPRIEMEDISQSKID